MENFSETSNQRYPDGRVPCGGGSSLNILEPSFIVGLKLWWMLNWRIIVCFLPLIFILVIFGIMTDKGNSESSLIIIGFMFLLFIPISIAIPYFVTKHIMSNKCKSYLRLGLFDVYDGQETPSNYNLLQPNFKNVIIVMWSHAWRSFLVTFLLGFILGLVLIPIFGENSPIINVMSMILGISIASFIYQHLMQKPFGGGRYKLALFERE